MDSSSLLNERLVCMSRVHSRAAAFVASSLGMDLANFHLYTQHPKSREEIAASTSTRRKATLRLSATMVERLCALFKFGPDGFTEPMLDSWLVRNVEDWERLNQCFQITPLLAIDTSAAKKALGTIEITPRHGLNLIKQVQPPAGEMPSKDVAKLDIEKDHTERNKNYLYQFLLAKVVVDNTWRAVLIRMTGTKLQDLLPAFWNDPKSDLAFYHYPKRQNLFQVQAHLQTGIVSHVIHQDQSPDNVSEMIRRFCYPIIQEHIDKRFDAERQDDPDTGAQKLVLLGRPERLRRYAQLIRQMFDLTPDRMNSLGGTATLGMDKAEVEVGCVFEEESSLIFREPITRKPGATALEYIVVLREHKNGIVEIAYNGPREYLLRRSKEIWPKSENDVSMLVTKRVLHDSQRDLTLQRIDWHSITLSDLRETNKDVSTTGGLPYAD